MYTKGDSGSASYELQSELVKDEKVFQERWIRVHKGVPEILLKTNLMERMTRGMVGN